MTDDGRRYLDLLRVLFVCTGNICRSPFAEAYARSFRLDIEAASAGTFAFPNRPATTEAIAAGRDFGVDLSDHRSQQLTAPMIEQADLVFAAAGEHTEEVRALMPTAPVALLDPDGRSITDPYGRSPEVYQEVFSEIRRAIHHRLQLQS